MPNVHNMGANFKTYLNLQILQPKIYNQYTAFHHFWLLPFSFSVGSFDYAYSAFEPTASWFLSKQKILKFGVGYMVMRRSLLTPLKSLTFKSSDFQLIYRIYNTEDILC